MRLETKECTACEVEKPTDAFYRRADGAGLRSRCKDCLRRSDEERARRRALRRASPERAILANVIQRCHNARNTSFANYGGRGIQVCERWRESFEAFLADMGPRPSPDHSIERRDNDGSYSPENCVWATKIEQNRNTRQNVLLTINGRTQCRSAWAAEVGIRAHAIRDRMEKLGWPAERAVLTPVDPKFRRRAA